MGVLISGLDNEACAALFAPYWPHQQLQWKTADEFLQQAEVLEPRTDAGRSLGWSAGAPERLLWLYQAPWTLGSVPSQLERRSTAVALGLVSWYRQQRAALALRRTLGERMLLVNADRVSGTEILARLGLTGRPDQAAEGPGAASRVTAGSSSREAASAAAGRERGHESWRYQAFDDPVGQGLAKLFEWSLPHYWDLFEDLEATAWLPAGEPLFRRNLQPVTVEGIEQLLIRLQQGLRAPEWRAELDQSSQLAASLEQRLRETEAGLKQERTAHAELRGRLTRRVAELEEHADQLEAAHAAMAAERDASQAALADARARLSELSELEQAVAEARRQLERAQQELAEEQAAKAELERAQQAEAEAARSRAQALREDNQQLTAELHQLRDAHEGQIAANRELRSRLARSTETLDRARVQLCRQLARGPS